MKRLLRILAILAAALIFADAVAEYAMARGGGGGRGGGGRGGGGRGGGRGGRGFGGRGGRGGDMGPQTPKEVLKEAIPQRLEDEKQACMSDGRDAGAIAAVEGLYEKERARDRESAAAGRRLDWRARANPR